MFTFIPAYLLTNSIQNTEYWIQNTSFTVYYSTCPVYNKSTMNIKENVDLKECTYYEIGGPARYFIEAKTVKEVKKALQFAWDKDLPLFVLGSGTNVLISDSGFPGLVIRIQNTEYRVQDTEIVAGAGVQLSKIVDAALDNNLAGLEWAAGIPGTVGGAVRGNAGAFGGSMADVVKEVELIETRDTRQETRIKKLKKDQMGFGYRTSKAKKEGGIIYKVVLGPLEQVEDGEMKEIKEEAEEHMEYRNENQPYDRPSCGSVFKAAVVKKKKLSEPLRELKKVGELVSYELKNGRLKIPAGWLVDKAGLKGKRIDGAQISKKHANFIVNLGDARAEDVRELIELARRKVKEKFGVDLECEVELVGF